MDKTTNTAHREMTAIRLNATDDKCQYFQSNIKAVSYFYRIWITIKNKFIKQS